MKEGIKYRHKKSGKIYFKALHFGDHSIKQTSEDEWEEAVSYYDAITYQPFITGLKRFTENFELYSELDELLMGKL